MSQAPPPGDAPGGPAPGDQVTVLQPTTHEDIPRGGFGAHLLGSLVPLAIGVACVAYAFSIGVGSPTSPGAGMWPLIASGVLVVACVVLLVTERGGEDYEMFTAGTRNIVFGVISLGIFIFLFPRIGIEASTLLLMGFWLKVLGQESWKTTVVVSVGTLAAFYALFILLLGVPLPRLA